MHEPHQLLDGLAFPEGPCFTPDGALWWVEIESGRLGRLRGGNAAVFDIGGRPNGAAFDAGGTLWIADQGLNAIRRFDPDSCKAEIIVDSVNETALGKPNDLCFDKHGNLFFTCSNDARTEPVGYLCAMTPATRVEKVADGLFFPNGLAISPDGRIVVAETYRQRLLHGLCAAGEIALEPFVDTGGPVGPDGIAFATDGSLFVANFGQGSVNRITPDGTVSETFTLPGSQPTNIALDPRGMLGLVVTEAETGAIYAFETDALPWICTMEARP